MVTKQIQHECEETVTNITGLEGINALKKQNFAAEVMVVRTDGRDDEKLEARWSDRQNQYIPEKAKK